MSKYDPLTRHLLAQTASPIRMTFAEIERVIGVALPVSAATHRAWWSNNSSNNVMTKAWLEAGFQSEQVDLTARKIAFRRVASRPPEDVLRSSESTRVTNDPSRKLGLFGWLRGTVSVAPGIDLTHPADPEWGLQGGHD